MGCKWGNSWAMISLSLWRETALNMFFMSKDTSALDGSFPCRWGWEMNLSTPNRSVFTMVVIPPETPTA